MLKPALPCSTALGQTPFCTWLTLLFRADLSRPPSPPPSRTPRVLRLEPHRLSLHLQVRHPIPACRVFVCRRPSVLTRVSLSFTCTFHVRSRLLFLPDFSCTCLRASCNIASDFVATWVKVPLPQLTYECTLSDFFLAHPELYNTLAFNTVCLTPMRRHQTH